MLVLAVDTSGRQGGITLARAGEGRIEIIESASVLGGTFSAQLIPQISHLLAKNDLRPQQLDGFVGVTGPGSFTGLRVGLAALKGLAEVLRKPIASVTSLEILIAASGLENSVIAMLDAGRGEVYVRIQDDGRTEMLLALVEAAVLASTKGCQIVTADIALTAKFENARLVQYRSSEVAAKLGAEKLRVGETVDVLALDANYIRRSEAEYLQKMKKE